MARAELRPAAGAFDGAEHVLPVRVYYEDTDFTGLVYHASYLRFFERGRTEFLRAAGVEHAALLASDDPAAFAVTKLSIQFRRAAHVDDSLTIRTAFRALRGARIEVGQRAVRDNETLAAAEVEVVCIRPDGRPRRPPAPLLARLGPFVAKSAP